MAVARSLDMMPNKQREGEAVYSYHEAGRPLLERRAVTSDGDSEITLIDGPERPDNLSPSMRGPSRPRARRSSSNKFKSMSMASGLGGIPSMTMMGSHSADMSGGQFRSYEDYKVVNLQYQKPHVYNNPKNKKPAKDLYAGAERHSPRQSYLFRKNQDGGSPKLGGNAAKRRSSYQPSYRKSHFDPSWRRSTLPGVPAIDPSAVEAHARRETGPRRPSYVSHSSGTSGTPSPPMPSTTNPFASRPPPPHPPVDVQLAPTPSPSSTPAMPMNARMNGATNPRGPSPPYQTVPEVRVQHSGSTLSSQTMQYEEEQQQQQQQQQKQPETIPIYHLHPNARKRKFQSMISRLADLLPKTQWFGRKMQAQQGRR